MIETLRAYPAPEAVLFDLDGTLVDSVEDIFVAVNALMRELGVAERSREEVTTWVGNGARMLVERAMGGRFEGFAGLPDALARHAAADAAMPGRACVCDIRPPRRSAALVRRAAI